MATRFQKQAFHINTATNNGSLHELSDSLDRKEQVDIAVLDFSRAFDKVSHTHLAIKLAYYGIRGSTLARGCFWNRGCYI